MVVLLSSGKTAKAAHPVAVTRGGDVRFAGVCFDILVKEGRYVTSVRLISVLRNSVAFVPVLASRVRRTQVEGGGLVTVPLNGLSAASTLVAPKGVGAGRDVALSAVLTSYEIMVLVVVIRVCLAQGVVSTRVRNTLNEGGGLALVGTRTLDACAEVLPCEVVNKVPPADTLFVGLLICHCASIKAALLSVALGTLAEPLGGVE
mmetsp:Transcript_14065/g.25737  ORF Transcript_14065/g.25737 Transcript_14065/m.25737 type:complete len:204 (-) Transcript_14065:3075-3686(-)